MNRSRPGGLAALRTLRLWPPNHNGALGRAISATQRGGERLVKDSVHISIYHHAMMAWLAWQEAEEAGDTERAEKAFRVYDFGFDLIGC